MSILCDGGIDELEAMCGGACACATCHVVVDAPFRGLLPQIGEQEEEMLNGLLERHEGSRLSCQLVVSQALDGIHVTVMPPQV